MTGRETLRHVARFRGVDTNREPWIATLLERVGIADAADRRTSTYSGGMRQRLGIAQALVGRPAVILLDEPVSALDPIGRKDVLDLMRELKGETTVFYSTHILDDVQRVSDHVAILDHGRLVKAAPTQVLLGSFTKNMLRVVLGGATRRPRRPSAASPASSPSTSSHETARPRPTTSRPGRRRVGRRPALHHEVRRRSGPDPDQQFGGDARSRDRLPATHRPEGGGGMTAQSVDHRVDQRRQLRRGGMFLGFRNVASQGAHRVVQRPHARSSSPASRSPAPCS